MYFGYWWRLLKVKQSNLQTSNFFNKANKMYPQLGYTSVWLLSGKLQEFCLNTERRISILFLMYNTWTTCSSSYFQIYLYLRVPSILQSVNMFEISNQVGSSKYVDEINRLSLTLQIKHFRNSSNMSIFYSQRLLYTKMLKLCPTTEALTQRKNYFMKLLIGMKMTISLLLYT